MVFHSVGIPLAFAILFLVFDVQPQNCGMNCIANFFSPVNNVTKTAVEGAWPWMVALTFRERNGENFTQWCNGFLIDHIHVMTAAHCLHDSNLDRYQARIGKVNQTEGEMYRLTRIATHELYNQRYYYNDIAILTLDRSMSFPGFNPICLPDPEVSRLNLNGIRTTMVGWGRIEQVGERSLTLQKLSGMTIMLSQNCNKIYGDVLAANYWIPFPQGITSDIICAGFPESRYCGDDSGGPLMLLHNNRWYAVGIFSFGISCIRSGIPDGYTKVSSYLDWISEKTAN